MPKIRIDDEFINWVFDYTLGIRLAIYAVIHYFIIIHTDQQENGDLFGDIAIQIKSLCKVNTYQELDTKLYYRLLEIS